MARAAGCYVTLAHSPGASYVAPLRYYELLRDALDRGETGWMEVEHVTPGGRFMIRLDDIVELFHANPEYVAARDAADAEERLGFDDAP